jgi:hypothetical protein
MKSESEKIMKIKNNYMLKEVAGQNIAVPVGDESIDFNAMISLNDTGAFLWHKLEEDVTEQQLVEALLEEYEVSKETAENDVSAFVIKMREAKLLDE